MARASFDLATEDEVVIDNDSRWHHIQCASRWGIDASKTLGFEEAKAAWSKGRERETRPTRDEQKRKKT